MQRPLLFAAALGVLGLWLAAVMTGNRSPVTPSAAPTATSRATTSPGPSETPLTEAGHFAVLSARPLVLPPLSSAGCQPSRAAEIDPRVAPASGAGPVFAVLGASNGRFAIDGAPLATFGRYDMKTIWVATDPTDDRILIRIGRLDGGSRTAGFEGRFVPNDEGMATQLWLGPRGSIIFGGGMPETWRAWSSGTLVPDPGCYAFQIDTTRATDHIIFEVTQ